MVQTKTSWSPAVFLHPQWCNYGSLVLENHLPYALAITQCSRYLIPISIPASGLRKWQLVGIKLNPETSWGSFLLEVTKSTSAIFLSWVKGSKVKVSNGTHIWTWMKALIFWEIGMGEFSSCKAYGDFYFSPQWKCVILCAQTITSSPAFLESIISGESCQFIIPQSHPHSWTHDQYEPIRIFLGVSHKIWRERAFFPL